MMAFTVCIALLAALSYGDDDAARSELGVLAVVWGTTVGLSLTQWFALTLSIWLVRDQSFRYSPVEMLVAQLAMALLVARRDRRRAAAAERLRAPRSPITAAVFLGVLVGIESRAGGWSARRTLGFVIGALAIGLAIATLKWILST